MRQKAQKFKPSLYVVINQETKEVFKKCGLREAAAWGKIIYAEQGIKCIAPVIGGLKMDLETFARAEELEADTTPLEVLEARVAKYYPDGELAEPVVPNTPAPKIPKAPKDPDAAPREGSVTRRVWLLADEALARLGSSDMKAVRAAVAEAAAAEEINPSTVSVQYSKWKAKITLSPLVNLWE